MIPLISLVCSAAGTDPGYDRLVAVVAPKGQVLSSLSKNLPRPPWETGCSPDSWRLGLLMRDAMSVSAKVVESSGGVEITRHADFMLADGDARIPRASSFRDSLSFSQPPEDLPGASWVKLMRVDEDRLSSMTKPGALSDNPAPLAMEKIVGEWRRLLCCLSSAVAVLDDMHGDTASYPLAWSVAVERLLILDGVRLGSGAMRKGCL